jgi:PIN domain nuclease of toxin-antitoxin system
MNFSPSGARKLSPNENSGPYCSRFLGNPGASLCGADESALSSAQLERAVVSTVNLAEVQAKLVQLGQHPEEAWADAISVAADAADFTSEHAKIAGALVNQTRPFGLSMGDRSSLALALVIDAPVYTADRIWSNLQVGVPIHIIR